MFVQKRVEKVKEMLNVNMLNISEIDVWIHGFKMHRFESRIIISKNKGFVIGLERGGEGSGG